MNTPLRPLVAIAMAGTLTFGLAACGDDDTDDTVAAIPVAEVESLTGVASEVILSDSFQQDLNKLRINSKVLGKAKRTGDTLAFPITGGSLTYYAPGTRDPFVESNILHENSGLQFKRGKPKVDLRNFVIDAGASLLYGDVRVNGKKTGENVPLFFLDGRTLEPLQTTDAGTAVLEGATVSLTAEAAQLLNDTFNTEALSEFHPVGRAEVVVQLPA